MTKVEERGLSVEEFLQLGLPVVDVRAPIEFDRGHIPDAINIPLLTNDDRHHVGLCYRSMVIMRQYSWGLNWWTSNGSLLKQV